MKRVKQLAFALEIALLVVGGSRRTKTGLYLGKLLIFCMQ